ncbi:hypothetical protein [Halobacillus sp. B23F22_1]|uniref:hypothetical protein n=1 Tax=Halobacillus sp. B23F22_1 TaxID=3459514 RepID=UPI00373FC12D
MLTFEEKMAIIEEFGELTKKEVSLGRVNFHYEESLYDKKNVVYHLHPNGNGFVYAGEIEGCPADDRGMVNIRDYSETELRNIVREAIDSLASTPAEKNPVFEEWMNNGDFSLFLMREDDGYNVYAGEILEGAFNSYEEAANFLEEEGFSRI